MKKMRIGFVTCVQLGLSCMEAIYSIGGTLDLVVTLEDNMARYKSGRIYVDEFSQEHTIPLLKVRNINHDIAVEYLKIANLDWLFVIGWSQILKEELLSIPRLGVIGMHPTLLPVGRGRAAIPWTILKELESGGVTMFKLDQGVDTGDILEQVEIPLPKHVDATWLYDAVDSAHISLIKKAWPKLISGSAILKKQDEKLASKWPGRTPEDGRLNKAGSVYDAERLIRAVTRPYPGAFIELDDKKIIIWSAQVISKSDTSEGLILDFSDGRLLCLDWECARPGKVN